MSIDVAAGVLRVQRAMRATAQQLDAVRAANPRSGFPHARLLRALPSSDFLKVRLDDYLADVLETPTSHTTKTLHLTASPLEQLHSAAERIRSAVEWASEFAAIDWWIARRLEDLQLPSKIILVAPGHLGACSVESTSRFRERLVKLSSGDNNALARADGRLGKKLKKSLKRLEDLHLLHVSSFEGISPTWRPLILGHELAHLKLTPEVIRKWLGTMDLESHSEPVGEAARLSSPSDYTPPWLKQLVDWLVEIACDSAASYFYGEAASAALASHLAAHGAAENSDTHPAPSVRLAIQAGDSHALQALSPGELDSDDSKALRALVVLGVDLRDYVHDMLHSDVDLDSTVRDATAVATHQDLTAVDLPSSHAWDTARGLRGIESGLVAGLWRRRAERFSDVDTAGQELIEDENLVAQALDALEFAARFDEHIANADDTRLPPVHTPNVLWISASGAKSDPLSTVGIPAYDLRLGRYFLVFQRMAVAELSSLGEVERRPPRVQRSVEIGWGDDFILHPGELVLGVTFEEVRLATDCVAQVLSRSSLGRLGLLSATAVHIQPGFIGCLTLELVNLASVPLRLSPGQRIAQIVPAKARGDTSEYAGIYQRQRGKPQFSRIAKDWDAEVLRAMRPSVRA